MPHPTITDTILMVRPANFGYNEQTAENNAFQVNDQSLSVEEIKQLARDEFDAFVEKLRGAGVRIIVIEDTSEPLKYDSVFPNNWFSTHATGLLITYPINPPMRRQERRPDIIAHLMQEFGFTRRIELEHYEEQGLYLEGTGSLIMDRERQFVYACRSARTDEQLLEKFAKIVDCQKVLFDAVDRNGHPIYHTNVMMALGTTFCVICLESISDEQQRQWVVKQLESTGKEVVDISFDQMESFAGNMLQVESQTDGQSILVTSQQAYESLTPEQIKQLEKHTQLLHSDLRTIETYGGGSARCMMAEIFPPQS